MTNQPGRDTLGGPDPAGPEDELGGPDRGPEDELGGPTAVLKTSSAVPTGARRTSSAVRANPRGIDFPCLLSMLHDSFTSRPNLVVRPGGSRDARPDGMAASIGPFG